MCDMKDEEGRDYQCIQMEHVDFKLSLGHIEFQVKWVAAPVLGEDSKRLFDLSNVCLSLTLCSPRLL